MVVIIYTILRPDIIKPLLFKFAYTGDYEPLPIARSVGNYTWYRDEQSGNWKHRDLIVIVIGGAFMLQSLKSYYGIANAMYTSMSGQGYDVVVVQYPVRFKHTIQQAMLSLNETLKDIALTYKACHFIGFSAGALLAGTFIRKERNEQLARAIKVPQIGLRVDSFTSICGLLYANFENDILNALFNFYVMRGTASAKSYHAQALNVPTFLISSQNDILHKQTIRYVRSEQCESKIYKYKITHLFVQLINLKESQECIKEMIKFIRKSSNMV